MGMKALVKDAVYLLARKHPYTGQTQHTSYVGALRNKPKGWKVVKYVGPAMRAETGTV